MAKLRTITVAKLIELLEEEPLDALVIFAADYGDRAHTEQALGLRGECEAVTVTESAYSDSGFAIGEPDDDEEDADQTYVVLR